MHQPAHAQFATAVARVAPGRTFYAGCRSALLALVRLPGRLAAIRRDMTLLGAMDDRELADIGLSRQDLRDATALPIGQHPDRLLGARAASRRRYGMIHRLR